MGRPKGSKNKTKEIKLRGKKAKEIIIDKMEETISVSKPVTIEKEICKNPFLKKGEECLNENIWLYIQIEDEKCPICQGCWCNIADSAKEWGDYKPDFSKREIEEMK